MKEHQKIRRPSNSLSFNTDSDAAPSQELRETPSVRVCEDKRTKTEHSTQQQHQQSQNKRYKSKTGRQTLQIKTGSHQKNRKTVRDPSREHKLQQIIKITKEIKTQNQDIKPHNDKKQTKRSYRIY